MSTYEPFPLELDHVYILVANEAPEAALLQSIGLHLLDQVTEHTGQGTASRVFLFKNMYLEFVWVTDRQERLQRSELLELDLFARDHWRETKASPFGVGLHYKTNSPRSLPFPTSEHRAPWMPPSAVIEIIPKTSTYEPIYFIVSDELAYTGAYDWETTHALGVHNLTNLRITVTNTNSDSLSPIARLLTENRVLQIQVGPAPLLELTFDSGQRGQTLDCRPTLPLVVQY